MEPSENPYEAPQMPLAQVAPAADPTDFWPGELPCHRCGRPVPAAAGSCPYCAARPLYDRLQLWLTAISIFVVINGSLVWQQIRGTKETLPSSWLIAIAGTLAIWFGMQALFKKLRRGRW